jgi:esterase/lipase
MKDDNLINKIIIIIKNKSYDKIFISGHSMGCGLALYTTLILCNKFIDKKFELITFEQPKMGNYELKKYIKEIQNLNHIGKPNGKIKLIYNMNNKLSFFKNYNINDHYFKNIIHNIFKYINKVY